MKILQLSSQDGRGGASRGAYWVHQGLRKIGVDSQMLVAIRYTDDATVHLCQKPFLNPLWVRLQRWNERRAFKPYPHRNTTDKFSPAFKSANLTRAIEQFNPEVINLHWVNNNFVRPEDLPTWRRPIVWTARDLWPITGGCHLTHGCTRYQAHCGCCPELSSNDEKDLSYSLWSRKQKTWENLRIHFVALSQWSAERIRSSSLAAEQPISVIPNAIDVAKFSPEAKQEVRRRLNLPLDKEIVLYGAIKFTEKHKGYEHFVKAVHTLNMRPETAQLHVVTFGRGDSGNDLSGKIPVTHMGYLSDDQVLKSLYCAADVIVIPSLEEAFGKTAAEALACERPVVCFDATGLRDIVEHQHCGYRAEPFSSEDLANGILWVLADKDRLTELGQRGRAKVVAEFSLSRVAEQYKALYSQVIDERTSNGRHDAFRSRNA